MSSWHADVRGCGGGRGPTAGSVPERDRPGSPSVAAGPGRASGSAAEPGRWPAGLRPAVLTAGVTTASGLLVGLAWWRLAPRVGLVPVAGGQLIYADPEPEQAIAADGWFGLLGIGVGLLAGLLAWIMLRRWRGPAILIGLAVGCLAAAVLASWLGHELGFADFRAARAGAAVGERLDGPLLLRARGLPGSELGRVWRPTLVGVIPLQALAAVLVYTCLAAFSAHPTLRDRAAAPGGPGGPGRISSGPAAPATATTAPAPPEPDAAA